MKICKLDFRYCYNVCVCERKRESAWEGGGGWERLWEGGGRW